MYILVGEKNVKEPVHENWWTAELSFSLVFWKSKNKPNFNLAPLVLISTKWTRTSFHFADKNIYHNVPLPLCFFCWYVGKNLNFLTDKELDISPLSGWELTPIQMMFRNRFSRWGFDICAKHWGIEGKTISCLSAVGVEKCKACACPHFCVWNLCNAPSGFIPLWYCLDIQLAP